MEFSCGRKWLALLGPLVGPLVGLLFASCFGTSPALAATLHGKVVRVADGDTITVADGRQRRIKVRLSGIDAPEKLQPYGRLSAANLATLLLGKAVTVAWDKRDAYGRVIGRVLVAPASCPSCGPSEDAGLAQIAAGYAWWYRRESRELGHEDKARYAFAENAARARHRGLWLPSSPQPVPPWEWRHRLAGYPGHAGHPSAPPSRSGDPTTPAKVVTLHPRKNLQPQVLNP